MTAISSSLTTGGPNTRMFNTTELHKARGVMVQYDTLADLNTGISANPLWAVGQLVRLATEPSIVYRVYNGTHARTIIIGVKELLLTTNSNTVLPVIGIPTNNTGTNGDYAVDIAGNSIYLKTSGIWASVGPIIASGSGTTLISVPFANQWDSIAQKDMGDQILTGPLSLTSSPTNAILGGLTQAVIIGDGTNIPTVDGVPMSPFNVTAGEPTLITLIRVGALQRWFSTALTKIGSVLAGLRMNTLSGMIESGNSGSGWVYTSSDAVVVPSWISTYAAHTTRKLNADGLHSVKTSGTRSYMVGITTAPGGNTYQEPTFNGLFAENTVNAVYNVVTGGTGGVNNANVSVTHALGDIIKAERTGTTVTFSVAREETPSTFILVHTFTGISGTLYFRLAANQPGAIFSNINAVGAS